MVSNIERILILAKTYPSPSARYCETSCVAGLNDQGQLRRLYPVPFRLIEQGRQFQKWQWIKARVEKANKDHRPESFKILVDTIECGDVVPPTKGWTHRWPWLDQLPVFSNSADVEAQRQETGGTLALLRPKSITGLEVTPARSPDWTEEEKAKLVREQMQGRLFDEEEARRQVRSLRKIPFDFYYHYVCNTPAGDICGKHKIVDWEVGALYWNCVQGHGDAWEGPFRAKLEKDLLAKDLMFLMGTVHRFPQQWLIVGLFYPPKRPLGSVPSQQPLF